ncbi:hypothetical protein TPHA_0L00770 [Tetrapisispora phaffii CBS 4417]|uniref:Golgi apyrase n=1 Tax=Tetrapisispora phaffii (strain ATCC 24235 / CBS 4417 / NBRC 1672 / NRRL Y-8282 / UCD 70-5) TaxID=1071381 RepID=G8BZV5_TETPH|nr:hypothetical protein TPHA_0L00770 [Tetrapisispora phaffii CBS 4417]CCE65433.1 hypothetical protein TPHA_0L00770 [Tetrapisispora phaffii CBS 4417]
MLTDGLLNENYGIVIDAGSSGSRIHVYKWNNSKPDSEDARNSVPQIHQEADWTSKTTPGLSSYEKKPHKAFKKHIKPLLDYAEKIVPKNKIKETPVFIQATAGMRLLPEKRQQQILSDLCDGFKHSSNFLMKNCEAQIQIIDGETEGLYGWLSLNYLKGMFNNYDAKSDTHFTFGFMDMGGASTQIAFSPSDKEQVKKHKEDIPTIYLRTLNGEIQKWDVFVSSWLGFGANQARKRYFAQLVNSLPENVNDYDDDNYATRKISDPCMPKGCESKFELYDKKFTAVGTGHSEQCEKLIYPLLLKQLPCIDEPCLFNGVHAPQIDFLNDKFVGVSEYWYTANDVFKLGGEYNFQDFSSGVKEFCNSNWSDIKKKGDEGYYNSIPDSYLAASCFKANWVLNVLHEGFGLPFEKPADASQSMVDHPTFQSAEKIDSHEISWTLGRILLYASGSILAGSKDAIVGIQPSKLSAQHFGKKFIPGSLEDFSNQIESSIGAIFNKLVVVLLVIFIVCFMLLKLKIINKSDLPPFINSIHETVQMKINSYYHYNRMVDSLSNLEEGISMEASNYVTKPTRDIDLKLRSKSMQGLDEISAKHGMDFGLKVRSKTHVGAPFNKSRNDTSPTSQGKLKTAFSLADFSKYKLEKITIRICHFCLLKSSLSNIM